MLAAAALLVLPQPRAAGSVEAVTSALRQQLQGDAEMWAGAALDWRRLREFYQPRRFRPVWCDDEGPLHRAPLLKQTLEAADEQGLDAAAYHLVPIRQHWYAQSAEELAWLDLLMTDAFLRYSKDVRTGRYDPRRVDADWHIEVADVDPVALLHTTLEAGDFAASLRELPPVHPGYRRLRQALARYRRIATQGPWSQLPPGPVLRTGDRHPQVALLRRRLLAEGDLVMGPVVEESFFDLALKDAVERFQLRHGLDMDGMVGRGTRAALNAPVATRIEQIRHNMERWRWLPRQLGERYLMVNLGGFELAVAERETTLFTMRVIIGRPYRATPQVAGALRYMVFNPYWHVPPRVAVEDLLPKQRRDPDFFVTRGIRVFSGWGEHAAELKIQDIDWTAVSVRRFPYKLRQDPGPYNSMGRVKFVFPNRFAVYLHDTPQRELFDQEVRTFSAGCIRIESPLRLAAYLLQGKEEWTAERIQDQIVSGETLAVALPEAVSVYLINWTAWVGEDATVYFRTAANAGGDHDDRCG